MREEDHVGECDSRVETSPRISDLQTWHPPFVGLGLSPSLKTSRKPWDLPAL